ncbi:MAG: Tol-Pal system beta propeller repeat protein TolB [Elusimicrobiota bacterium]|jgi:TolB protein
MRIEWTPAVVAGRFSAFLVTAVLIFPAAVAGAADVYLGLQAYSQGGKALGVGIAPFTTQASDSESDALSRKLRSVIRNDLLFEQLFTIVEGGPAVEPKLDSLVWSGVGAQVVISGEARLEGTQVRLECRIYDVASGKMLWAKEGTSTKESSRRLAHLLSDQLTFQLSGQPGVAHTRIVFVNNRTRRKELYIMDYDGANIRQLTSYHSITLLPKWSPDGKTIAFNSYRAGNPDAYLIEADGSSRRVLSDRQGLNTAPAWAPDSQTLAVTLSRGGDPDIYLVNRQGQQIRRLTRSTGVDTSPAFSPNGQQMAFVSDRSGNPELYTMDVTGANVQRLTYGQWADGPAWSPRGDWIAYERQRSQGRFDIYVMESSGRNSHVISEAGARNENPSWSPDGRFIAYASDREGGRSRICLMAADGSSPHCVGDIDGDSTSPSWGP